MGVFRGSKSATTVHQHHFCYLTSDFMILRAWVLCIDGKDNLLAMKAKLFSKSEQSILWSHWFFASMLSCEHLCASSRYVPTMTSFEPWFVLLSLIVCTQRMSTCSFMKGHSVGSPTRHLSLKYSILGRSLTISDSLVTNKHTHMCWKKAGRTSKNSIWPPLSMRYIQSGPPRGFGGPRANTKSGGPQNGLC